MPGHVPVLLAAVLEQLRLQSNDNVIDATLGGGGHARAMLDQIAPQGRLLGIEADPRTLKNTQTSLQPIGDRAVLAHGNFSHLKSLATTHGFSSVAGILFDLGLSSLALADHDRGFSFQSTGPLDMRFDPTSQTLTAAEIVQSWSSDQLTTIFRDLGEERMASRIADAIAQARTLQPITTTTQLAEVIETVKPRRGRIHPATQVFQALRMAVNDELGSLQAGLTQAVELLRPGGRLAVITFHSIEDRTVKVWGKQAAQTGMISIVTKHVVKPERAEVLSNPRARSAKLRIYQRQ